MNARRVAAALLVVATIVPAAPSEARECPGFRSTGRWTVVTQPTVASRTIAVSYGRDGRDTLYGVGDSRTIVRSGDGGCTWAPVLSLDTAGAATDTFRLDPTFQFLAVSVAQGTSARPRAVYAIAGDDGRGYAAALPIVTFVSTDDGAHWTLHQATTDDLRGDYPRCSQSFSNTQLLAGPDPSTVYLRCNAGEYVDTAANCPEALYVTRDAARTWQPIVGRAKDLAKVSASPLNLGCATFTELATSRTPHELWDVRYGTTTEPIRFARSRDDGRTFTTVVHGTGVASPDSCSCSYFVRAQPDGRLLGATWDPKRLYVTDAATVLRQVPFPVSRRGTITAVTGAMPLPDARGRDRVLVTFTLDGRAATDAFLYDPLTRRWSALEPPGKRYDLGPAWTTVFWVYPKPAVPGIPTVYFVTWDGALVRYAA